MKCADLQSDVLVDLVDGRLEPAVQREVERHLEACPECRALVTDLRSIRASAFMLDRREPPMATWNKLQDAIASEPAPKGKLLAMPGVVRRSLGDGGWPVWLGAAAALILAMVIGLLPLIAVDVYAAVAARSGRAPAWWGVSHAGALGMAVGFAGFVPVLALQKGSEQLISGLTFLSWPELAMIGAALCTSYGWILLRVLVKDSVSPLKANGFGMLIGGLLALGHSYLAESWNPTPIAPGDTIRIGERLF